MPVNVSVDNNQVFVQDDNNLISINDTNNLISVVQDASSIVSVANPDNFNLTVQNESTVVSVTQDIMNLVVNGDTNLPSHVDITIPTTQIVEIISPGPQGPIGPRGADGATISGGTDGFLPLWSGSDDITISIVRQTSGSIQISGSTSITGSLIVTGGITGSLLGTSSQAISSSYSNNSTSASYASTASSAPLYLPLTGGTIDGNLTVTGTASIAFLNVTFESASVIYSSGSNQFGDATNDTQTLIGTVLVSGSQQITGSLNVSQGITGSLFGTASYATQALSASWAPSQNIDTGSLLTTSSFNQYTGSSTSQFAGTSSFAYSSSISANTVLQTGITSNATVGGAVQPTTFNAGTSLETIIRTMLVTYLPPTLSSLVVRNNGTAISTATREVGASFTVNTASFSATADNPNEIYPLSASFTASGATIGIVQYYFGDNVLGSTNTLSVGSSNTYTRSTSGSIVFTVNGRRADTLAAITGLTATMAFQWRNYLEASSTIITNDITAQTVVDTATTSSLSATKAWTATCTAANDTLGNYTYIIYPAHFGDLTGIIQNGATPVLGAFTKLGDYNVINANSITLSHRVYKSNSDKAFASGTTLAIS